MKKNSKALAWETENYLIQVFFEKGFVELSILDHSNDQVSSTYITDKDFKQMIKDINTAYNENTQ